MKFDFNPGGYALLISGLILFTILIKKLMKKNILLTIIILLMLANICNAGNCTANSSGNWQSISIWSCGHIPQAGDSIVIPASVTVTLATSYSLFGLPVYIKVNGKLNYNGHTLSLPCCSDIFVNNPGEMFGPGNLIICSENVWSGKNVNGKDDFTSCTALSITQLNYRTQIKADNKILNFYFKDGNLFYETDESYDYMILDLQGKLLESSTLTVGSGFHKILLSDGIYIICLSNGINTFTKRIIILN